MKHIAIALALLTGLTATPGRAEVAATTVSQPHPDI